MNNRRELVNQIADRVVLLLREADPNWVTIGVSNRHVHLADADFLTLFGYPEPQVRRMARQTGEYAAQEKVTIHGPAGKLTARVMGPNRPQTQVELSKTDCFALGIQAPLAQSGQLDHAARVELAGPAGRVTCDHAAIVAGRHIHISPEEASRLNVKHQDRVSVLIGGERGARLDNVLIRVKGSYRQELHLDTDEGNAVNVRTGDWARICLRP